MSTDERVVATMAGAGEDSLDRSIRPQRLTDYVGQTAVKRHQTHRLTRGWSHKRAHHGLLYTQHIGQAMERMAESGGKLGGRNIPARPQDHRSYKVGGYFV